MRIGGYKRITSYNDGLPHLLYAKNVNGQINVYDQYGNLIYSNVPNDSGTDTSGQTGYYFVIVINGVIIDVPEKYAPCVITDNVVTCYYSQYSTVQYVVSWTTQNGTGDNWYLAGIAKYSSCLQWIDPAPTALKNGVGQNIVQGVYVNASVGNSTDNNVLWSFIFNVNVAGVNGLKGRCQEVDILGGSDIDGNVNIDANATVLENQPFYNADIEGP